MGKIVLLGCGAVAFSFLELLPRTSIIPESWYMNGIVVIEPKDITKHPVFPYIQLPLIHIRKKLTRKNYSVLLSKYADPGDVIVDLTVNVESMNIIKHCIKRSLLYINTSMEDWTVRFQEKFDTSVSGVIDRTLYMQNIQLEKLRDSHLGCSTIVTDHGMNPGLISHFAKYGLLKYAMKHGVMTAKDAERMVNNTTSKHWGLIAEKCGLRVIHCSEKDTQVVKSSFTIQPDTFYNTWSCHGFMAEGRDPVQFGYGTHEDFAELDDKVVLPKVGRKHQAFLPVRGMDLVMKSYVPGHSEIHGYCIPHGEAYSLSKFLSVEDRYRPSVYYVYDCSKAGHDSMDRLRHNKYVSPSEDHVFSSLDLSTGHDAVGALMCYENGEVWWSGTILDLKETRHLKFVTSPTVVQVSISIISAVKWIIDNPRKGIRTAEELPLTVLERCIPYLGNVIVEKVKYHSPASLKFQDFIVNTK